MAVEARLARFSTLSTALSFGGLRKRLSSRFADCCVGLSSVGRFAVLRSVPRPATTPERHRRLVLHRFLHRDTAFTGGSGQVTVDSFRQSQHLLLPLPTLFDLTAFLFHIGGKLGPARTRFSASPWLRWRHLRPREEVSPSQSFRRTVGGPHRRHHHHRRRRRRTLLPPSIVRNIMITMTIDPRPKAPPPRTRSGPRPRRGTRGCPPRTLSWTRAGCST
jgi:hypothetical protein